MYLLASYKKGTLYCGVTSDLVKRIWKHKNNVVKGFTQKYRVHDLVWYEQHGDVNEAIHREKCIKTWKRDWKIELIEKENSDWDDLYETII